MTEQPSQPTNQTRTRSREDVEAAIKAYDIRGVVEPAGTATVDEDFVFDAGAAFASILRGEGETTLACLLYTSPSPRDRG